MLGEIELARQVKRRREEESTFLSDGGMSIDASIYSRLAWGQTVITCMKHAITNIKDKKKYKKDASCQLHEEVGQVGSCIDRSDRITTGGGRKNGRSGEDLTSYIPN